MADRYAGTGTWKDLSLANAALLLAVSGKGEEARKTAAGYDTGGIAARSMGILSLEWCLLVIGGRFTELLAALDERVFARSGSDRAALADRFLLSVLHELTGNADRALRGLEVIEKQGAAGPLRRLVLPVSYLLGKATEEELWRNPGCNPLAGHHSDSVLFYLLGLVQKRRRKRARAKILFRYAVKADPLRFWARRLAGRKLAR